MKVKPQEVEMRGRTPDCFMFRMKTTSCPETAAKKNTGAQKYAHR